MKKSMIDSIIISISKHTPYSPKEIKVNYDKLKSLDVLLSAINIAQKFNMPLENASSCLIVSEVFKNYE